MGSSVTFFDNPWRIGIKATSIRMVSKRPTPKSSVMRANFNVSSCTRWLAPSINLAFLVAPDVTVVLVIIAALVASIIQVALGGRLYEQNMHLLTFKRNHFSY